MACISCLPLELLWMVFSCLTPTDLRAFARVARAFLFVARPCIFGDTLVINSTHDDGDFDSFWFFAAQPRNQWIGRRTRKIVFRSEYLVFIDEESNGLIPDFHCAHIARLLKFCPSLNVLCLSGVRFIGSSLDYKSPAQNLHTLSLEDVITDSADANPLILLSMQQRWLRVDLDNCRWRAFNTRARRASTETVGKSVRLSLPRLHALCDQFFTFLPLFAQTEHLHVESFCASSVRGLGGLLANINRDLKELKIDIEPFHKIGNPLDWDMSYLSLATAVTTFSLEMCLHEWRDFDTSVNPLWRADLFRTLSQQLPPNLVQLSITFTMPAATPAQLEDNCLELVDWDTWSAEIRSYSLLRHISITLVPIGKYCSRVTFDRGMTDLLFEALLPRTLTITHCEDFGEKLVAELDANPLDGERAYFDVDDDE